MRSITRMIPILFSVCLTGFFAAGAALAEPPPHYRAPDLKTPIFGGALTFDLAQRQSAATALADLVRNTLELSDPDANRNATRLLGIALRLDPKNRQAVIVNGYLADGQQPQRRSDWNQDDAVTALHHAADSAKAANTPPDTTAAAYLYASLLLVRADDDDRFALETLKTSGATVNWDWADQSTGITAEPGAKGQSAYHLPARIKPADRAAIQQSLRDNTTIRSLVVVSTGESQPHGKTLEIIAVAPKDEDAVFPRIRVDPAVMPILVSIEDYCASADRLAEAIQDGTGDRNSLQSECFRKAAAVRDQFRKLVEDDNAVDKLLRDE